MKEVFIDKMVFYKKYLFILKINYTIEFFTARYYKYNGKGWIKLWEPLSLIGNQPLDFDCIANFEAYELKESYKDFIFRQFITLLYYLRNRILIIKSYPFFNIK